MQKGIPFDHIKEVNEQRYYELMEFRPYIQAFNVFVMAKELGITFAPTDLDIEQVTVFSTMNEEITKNQKRGSDGR